VELRKSPDYDTLVLGALLRCVSAGRWGVRGGGRARSAGRGPRRWPSRSRRRRASPPAVCPTRRPGRRAGDRRGRAGASPTPRALRAMLAVCFIGHLHVSVLVGVAGVLGSEPPRAQKLPWAVARAALIGAPCPRWPPTDRRAPCLTAPACCGRVPAPPPGRTRRRCADTPTRTAGRASSRSPPPPSGSCTAPSTRAASPAARCPSRPSSSSARATSGRRDPAL